MPSNKDRVCVALYVRGQNRRPEDEETFHWALLTIPKKEGAPPNRGTRYHVRNRMQVSGQEIWIYEASTVESTSTPSLLVRIIVGKVEDMSRLQRVLADVPLKQGDRAWTCKTWVKDALAALDRDGKAVGTRNMDWKNVSETAVGYVKKKKAQHRWDAQGKQSIIVAATYDLLDGRETVP